MIDTTHTILVPIVKISKIGLPFHVVLALIYIIRYCSEVRYPKEHNSTTWTAISR